MIKYIADCDHYTEVLTRCSQVKHDLWIATADLKELYVDRSSSNVRKGVGRQEVEPFLAVIDRLLQRGVEVRLLHAKEPGDNFRDDFDRFPDLWSRLERRLCPRVHFKILIFDCTVAYIGSANLTGAGIGMKGEGNRNFEAGILTDEANLVDSAADHIDSVWQGRRCKSCRRRDFCGDRIADN